jgi:hypothetical protein
VSNSLSGSPQQANLRRAAHYPFIPALIPTLDQSQGATAQNERDQDREEAGPASDSPVDLLGAEDDLLEASNLEPSSQSPPKSPSKRSRTVGELVTDLEQGRSEDAAGVEDIDAIEGIVDTESVEDEPGTPMQLDDGEPSHDIDDIESVEDEPGTPMQLDDGESWYDIDELEDESEGSIEAGVTEPVANRSGISTQAEASIEVDVEDESDEALLDAQLQGADTPQVDFAYELSQHLLHFKGCSPEEHLAMLTLHDRTADSPSHLSIDDYATLLEEARLPRVIEKASLLTAAERSACAQPDWQRIFEGNVAPRFSDDDEEVQDLDLSDENEETDLDSSNSDEERDRDGDASDQEVDLDRTATSPESKTSPGAEGEALAHSREHAGFCLRCSQSTRGSAEMCFDIDSFLGYASSLAFARQGVAINLYPRFSSNIKSNLHLYSTVHYDFGRGEKAISIPLHKVPHYYLGRVIGHEDTSVFILFPRMFYPEKETNFPGRSDGEAHGLLRTWTDQLLLPAIFRHIPASSRQHFPISWDHARRKAIAHSTEHRGLVATKTPSLSLHYILHPNSLATIWQDIQQQLTDPANQIYHGAQLVFSSKNTKLRFAYPTIAGVWEAFDRALAPAFDLAFLDRARFWIDLGKEVACTDYAMPREELAGDSEPATYLVRSCCQASFVRWAREQDVGTSAKATTYPVATLRDAQDMTVEMSPRSTKRQQGWVFSQVYNSFKEQYDAAKTKPFSHPRLSRLAWDSVVAQMLQQQGKGRATTPEQIRRCYIASKERLYRALLESRKLSFGVREEHRISLAFFDRLRQTLEAGGNWATVRQLADDDYSHFWELPTDSFISFLALNANKFMAAIEWTLCLEEPGRVSYERCKLATMLLQCLPFAFDSGPIRERTDIWQPKIQRRRGGAAVLGMGIKDAISRAGYGWFLPRVDWERLEFRRPLAHRMAFASSMLRDTYRRNWARVVDSKNDLERVEAAGQWIELYWAIDDCQAIVIQFLLVLIMRSYRKEVFRHFKALFRPESREEAALGKIMLCPSSLDEHLVDDWHTTIHLISPQRSLIRNIQDLLELLWGFNDRVIRAKSWSDAPFRVICQRACELIKTHVSSQASADFHGLVGRYFIATHWLIPYPTPTKFVQRNHDKQPLWIEFYHQRLAYQHRRKVKYLRPDLALRTTIASPQVWRPSRDRQLTRYAQDTAPYLSKLRKEKIDLRRARWYMPDWDLARGQGDTMWALVPMDYQPNRPRIDGDLRAIGRVLEEWHQITQRLATDVDEQDPAPRAADGLVFGALRSTANLGLGAQLPSNSSSSFGERGTDEEELIPTNRRPARRPSRPEQARASYGLVEESSDEDNPLLDDQGAGALGREHVFQRTPFIIYEDGMEE